MEPKIIWFFTFLHSSVDNVTWKKTKQLFLIFKTVLFIMPFTELHIIKKWWTTVLNTLIEINDHPTPCESNQVTCSTKILLKLLPYLSIQRKVPLHSSLKTFDWVGGEKLRRCESQVHFENQFGKYTSHKYTLGKYTLKNQNLKVVGYSFQKIYHAPWSTEAL